MIRRRAAIDSLTEFLRRQAAGSPAHGRGNTAWPEADDARGWQRIVATASAHLILPALREDLSAACSLTGRQHDAAAFVEQIHEANRRRNQALRAALTAAAHALNAAGIEPMVVKGGAFLAVDGQAAPWRFMADLDLLIEEARFEEAARTLSAMGYRTARQDGTGASDNHDLPLMHEDSGIVIELHRRLYRNAGPGPSPARLFANGVTKRVDGAHIVVPSPAHRIAHLIGHAQLHNRFYAHKRILLRDFLDLSALLRDHLDAIDWSTVMASFDTPREQAAARAFLAVGGEVLAMEAGGVRPGGDDRKWALAALRRLRWSRTRLAMTGMAGRLAQDGHRLAASRTERQRAVNILKNPDAFRATMAKRYAKFRQFIWS